MDKLGVRQGSLVEVHGLDDEAWFLADLRERGAEIGAPPPLDLVFFRADHLDDLDELTGLRPRIRPAGAIWVVRTKGNSRRLSDVDIIEAARRHGLVDNKIASFSDALSAMRLVIPLAFRGSGSRDNKTERNR
jgi:hypothetical protein